ncbi:MAG: extracellular solute-binding protein [Chloroflexi bacterium]|nr:extracellular solute-binding protein [Chloroflexota bacterium]
MLNVTSRVSIAVILIGLVLAACAPAAAPAPSTAPAGQVAGAANKAAWELEWQQLVAAARKEGKVMVYTDRGGDTPRQLAEAFEKRFDIKMEFLVGRGEELTQKIQTEKNAGLYLVDVILTGTTTLLISMKPRGLLDRVDSLLLLPEVTDPKAWITDEVPFVDKDRTTIGMIANYTRYILRNTDFVKDGEMVSYKDILNPKWKGRITADDPTTSGTGNAFFTMLAGQTWGLEPTKEFMRQFVKQEPAITRDKRLSSEWVARGKYALGVAPTRQTAIEFMRAGAPLVFVKAAEGGKIGTSGGAAAIAAKRPHPNAARVFLNWVLSSEGNATFVRAQGMPGARRDAPREGLVPELFPDPDEKVYAETEETILSGEEMMKISKEIFAPLLKGQ